MKDILLDALILAEELRTLQTASCGWYESTDSHLFLEVIDRPASAANSQIHIQRLHARSRAQREHQALHDPSHDVFDYAGIEIDKKEGESLNLTRGKNTADSRQPTLHYIIVSPRS